ncbi:hypothetical protein PYK79_00735 [Streptomyces sp. ID05-04B]|uniref:hypothetical protein n=1 Tax=unclassified Streptomyces TaxID=2593676 RepID=UPI000D19DF35|nr:MULTISPECIES: hypothetical protein [unclassified Streptomyces]AVV43866.1 hypothetical protein C6376_22865 [Streptomyces sp. P3]MDX5562573.1 hypothetical protein [Streptomyces sp. ID05-04B]
MLSIIDARTGEPVVAASARRRPTRVEAHARGYGAASLRVLLVADLLVRALEMGGTPAWALLSGWAGESAALRAGAAALGMHPFEDGRDATARTGGAQVLHVVGADGPDTDGVRVAVAPAEGAVPDWPGPSKARDEPAGGGAAPDLDPAVLRLALLAVERTEPLRLDAAALDEARDTLARWRRAVADWARRPSRPVPDEVRGRLRAAWEDDLDVPGVLRVLRWTEDAGPELPDGARFETYAYADRLLGLELTRDVGARA